MTLEPIAADVPGAIFLADWYPDASALLLRQDHMARDALLRYDLSDRSTSVVVPAEGTISAGVHPAGRTPVVSSPRAASSAPAHG